MSSSKDTINNKIDDINIGIFICILFYLEIPDLFALDQKMFYHRFKTSNELCSIGLFTYESEMSTKKHRKMKCR